MYSRCSVGGLGDILCKALAASRSKSIAFTFAVLCIRTLPLQMQCTFTKVLDTMQQLAQSLEYSTQTCCNEISRPATFPSWNGSHAGFDQFCRLWRCFAAAGPSRHESRPQRHDGVLSSRRHVGHFGVTSSPLAWHSQRLRF